MQHIDPKIQAFLDGALDPGQTEAVLDHCRECPDCERALSEARAVWRLLDVDAAPDPTRPIYFAVRERQSRRPGPWSRFAFATASAAVALIGVMLGMQFSGVTTVEAEDEMLPDYYSQGTLFTSKSVLGDFAYFEDTVETEETP